MTDLKTIESAVIELTPETPVDRIAQVRDLLDFAKQECGRLGKLLDEQMADRIRETGEDIVIGPIRFYLGTAKKEKLRDALAAFERLLELCGGDAAAFTSLLASGWAKPGAIRKLCEEHGRPELFDELFETIEEEEIREGKPVRVKRLLRTDERFVTPKGGIATST